MNIGFHYLRIEAVNIVEFMFFILDSKRSDECIDFRKMCVFFFGS